MPLIFNSGETDIVNKIKSVPGIDVMQGEYTPDGWKPVLDVNGLFKPYVTIKFNAGFPTLDNGICGPDKDTLRNTFSIYVVSPDDAISRNLRDQIRSALLTNFQPTDGSSLKTTGGFSFVDSDLGYNRYVHNIGFAYLTNLS